MEHSLPFLQINLLFILMFASAYLLKKVSVPSIVSFLLVGFAAKVWLPPESTRLVEMFKEAGMILLFFFIGLEYSFERLRGMVSIWKPAFADLLLNFFPAVLIAKLFDFDLTTSLLIGAVFYPSSTSIVAKLLMDFKRLASPEAQLLIGILIFEDLVAIVLLSVLIPLVEFGSVEPRAIPVSLFKVFTVLLLFYLVYRFLIPRVQGWLDRVSEDESFVFFLLGATMVVGVTFKELGLSEALGAFLLGVLVPETRVMENIEHHLSALKELSIGVFFFMFAYESEVSLPERYPFVVLLVLLGVLLKVVSTYLAAYLFGLKRKSRLRASLSFVPRGEFSVVIASLEPGIKLIAIPFILATALLGSFLFVIAPKVADVVYPPKRKPRSSDSDTVTSSPSRTSPLVKG